MNERLEKLRQKMDPLPEGRCLAAVSGGADSVALMMLLCGGNISRNSRPEAVHVNHGLRGQESNDDEAFVRALCKAYDVRLHVYRPDLGGRKDENTAREARYRCFRQCMAETNADFLVLAHHADDLAETFMMRLLRGAGPEGLGCMKADDRRDGMRILRPMLKIQRAEIRDVLRESGIPWREDSSNTDPSYLRNDVRMRLMPLMEEMSPGCAGRIAAAAHRISAENELLSGEANRFLAQHAGERWLDYRELASIPAPMQHRILRQWWRNNAPPMEEHELNAEQTELLASAAAGGCRKVNLPGGLHAEKGRQALHLTGLPPREIPETPWHGKKTDFGLISLIAAAGGKNPGDGRLEQEVPAGFINGCTIRSRRPGDRITPFGMNGSRKLQDYLTDRGIDAAWRDEIPLLCRDSEVLLVCGVGAGRIPAWSKQADNIRLIWQGEIPWNR